MLTERLTVLGCRLKNLEESLSISLKNRDPLVAMMVRESRIYAFQRSAFVFRDILLYFHREAKENRMNKTIIKVLHDIESSEHSWSGGDNEDTVLKMLTALYVTGVVSEEEVNTLANCIAQARFFEFTPELADPKHKDKIIASQEKIFTKIPRFYYIVNRVLSLFLGSKVRYEND